jgi:hypothetical protein
MHPTTKNQVYSKESTINSYAWYLQAIPSKFSCATFQKSSKYFSFCDTVFSSWGRSDRICYLPYCYISKKRKKEKIKEKRHSSMVCESWWAADGIG